MTNYIHLHHFTCFFTNFPENFTVCYEDELRTTIETDEYGNLVNRTFNSTCYDCLWRSLYMFDDETCQQGGKCVGFIILKIFSILFILIGMIGTFTNILTVIVLSKGTSCAPSLATLLLPLAICDGVTSFTGILFCGGTLLALENLDRSAAVLRTVYIALTLGYYSRTTSMFLAVIITVERYCVVAKPLRAKEWFTVHKTKRIAIIATVVSLLAQLPRCFDSKWTPIGEDGVGGILPHHKLPGYDGYSYVVEYSDFAYGFYDKFCESYFILDFLMPLPTLVFFNFLLYREVGLSNSNRKKLQITCASHQSEVNAAKMFAVVVVILVLCHVLPIISHGIIGIYRLIHRDIGYISILTIGINSAVNFVIYCAFGKAFRNDFKELFINCPIIKQVRTISISLSVKSRRASCALDEKVANS
ncbi:unnamed protein product [Orchesella dallaii]|uniref:G-protein coupled receptors family 1 profile domain-containing protein n=1 Tax=Orchesella dallaii TaxID=48710 RepID=A0ABP1RDK1_9HEXA